VDIGFNAQICRIGLYFFFLAAFLFAFAFLAVRLAFGTARPFVGMSLPPSQKP
jgi:hypothetical protein